MVRDENENINKRKHESGERDNDFKEALSYAGRKLASEGQMFEKRDCAIISQMNTKDGKYDDMLPIM